MATDGKQMATDGNRWQQKYVLSEENGGARYQNGPLME
jgi:hypothetical protein